MRVIFEAPGYELGRGILGEGIFFTPEMTEI